MLQPSRRLVFVGLAAALCVGVIHAQAVPSAGAAAATAASSSSPSAVVRMRGVIQAVSADNLTVKDRASGEVVQLALTDKLVVAEVYAIALSDIQAGSYIGAAATPQADGTQRAIAITVFPEAARGIGDGHRPFDLAPDSTMTNATVADVAAAPTGRTMQLKYKDGAKTLVVPQGVPVVTFRPGDRSLLVPGASVSLSAQLVEGKPVAMRVNAGKNGFVLPY